MSSASEGALPDEEGVFVYDVPSGSWARAAPGEAVRDGVNVVYFRSPLCMYCRLLDIKLADLLRDFAGRANFVVVNCAVAAPCPPRGAEGLPEGSQVEALPLVVVACRAGGQTRRCARFEGVPSLAELRGAVRLALGAHQQKAL